MNKKINVVYTFKIKYSHEKHLKDITNDLKDEPVLEFVGAGMIEDKVYSYSCKRIGKGQVVA